MNVNEEKDVCALRGKNWRPRHDGITAYRPVRYIKHGRYRPLPQNGDRSAATSEEGRGGGLGCREIILSYSIFLYGTFRDDKSFTAIEKMHRSHISEPSSTPPRFVALQAGCVLALRVYVGIIVLGGCARTFFFFSITYLPRRFFSFGRIYNTHLIFNRRI